MTNPPDGRRSRAKREPLSRDRVLQAALAFIDERGIDDLSMRRLASTLEVEAMSLYNHVDDKDDLLNGVLDIVVDEADLEPRPGEHWKATVQRGAEDLLAAFAAHPNARELMVRYPGHRAQGVVVNTFMSVLHEAGYPSPAVHSAWHLISSYFNGYLMTLGHMLDRQPEEREAALRLLRSLPPEDYRHQHAEMFVDCGLQEEFSIGLKIVLDGMEQYLEEAREQVPRARGRRR